MILQVLERIPEAPALLLAGFSTDRRELDCLLDLTGLLPSNFVYESFAVSQMFSWYLEDGILASLGIFWLLDP